MKTQIYATFGPACKSESILKDMIQAGMTGMRLNLSHSTLRESEEYINAYRKAAEKCDVKPQILIDMQGPELRIGNLQKEILLEEGECVILGQGDLEIPVPDAVIASSEVDDELLLDDGKIKLEVLGKNWEKLENNIRDDNCEEDCFQKGYLTARVCRGGLLKGRKSIKNVNREMF